MFSPIFPSLFTMSSSDSKVRCEHCSSSTSSSHQVATIPHHNQIPLYPNLLLLNALYPQLNQQSQRVESQLALKSYCSSSQNSLLSELFKVTPHLASGEAHGTASETIRAPLTSAAKRRHRRKRNQLKRYAYLASTVAATTASMLDANRSATSASTSSSNFAKRKTQSPTNVPLIYNHNSFNCNHSNSDHFYNYYNASSNKIKSYSRYVYLCVLYFVIV